MILLIDNYDSFVFNLARYFDELGCETRVVRNDAITVDDIRQLEPQAVVISPGPCAPQDSGVSIDLVHELHHELPMLGVCLGHQAIAAAFGAAITRGEPMHGEADTIRHDGSPLFDGMQNPFRAGRYHSLIVQTEGLPSELRVTATTADGTIMALAHVSRPVVATQFHPESVLTENGHRLLENFLTIAGVRPHGLPTQREKQPTMPDQRPVYPEELPHSRPL